MTSEIQEKGQRAKAASYMLNIKTTCEKNEALKKIAEQLLIDQDDIMAENAKDLAQGGLTRYTCIYVGSYHAQ